MVKTLSFILTLTPRKIRYHIFPASKKIPENLRLNIIQTNLPYHQPSSLNFIGRFQKKKNINFFNDLIKENWKFKTWEQITHEFKIDKNFHFKWILVVHAISNNWEKKLTENTINSQNISYLNYDLTKSNQIYSFEKLTAKELYLISL